VPASPEADYGGVIAFDRVRELARGHDGFIIDQWGVMHDGTKPYPGAIECLEQLHAAGKHVVVLSNTGRPRTENIRMLAAMGFDARHFDRFVAAGEDAREAIERRATPFHAKLGRRFHAFTRGDNDVSLVEGIGLERVDRVADADFLIVIGIDSPRRSVADYEPELAEGAARKLPMICANPDIVRPSPQGLLDAPGALAQRYEQLGGEVFYHGKPHAAIYGSCLAALPGVAKDRVVCVGDSIEHDILGASRAGLKSAFVTGGIHAGELGAPWGQLPEPSAWKRFGEAAIARPDYLVPSFSG
jgi:HAD superfamily hydrolase (TIGR01459 family)